MNRSDTYNEALRAYHREEFDEAFDQFMSAAGEEHPGAQFMIGVLLESGQGRESDPLEAARWYERAATAGYPRAHTRLGILYLQGWGVNRNLEEAGKCFYRGALLGDDAAQLELGVMCLNGEGVEQSPLDAYAWYLLACAGGNEQAGDYLADIETCLSEDELQEAREKATILEGRIESIRVEARKAALDRSSPSSAPPTPSPIEDFRTLPETLTLHFHSIDDQDLKRRAGSVLLPRGFSLKGGVSWNVSSAGARDRLELIGTVDEERAGITLSPPMEYYWDEGAENGEGPSKWDAERKPLAENPRQFLLEEYLPRHRPELEGWDIVDENRLESMESQSPPATNVASTIHAVRFRLRAPSAKDGLEDILFCLRTLSSPMWAGTVFWGTGPILTLHSADGNMEGVELAASLALANLDLEPEWYRHRSLVQSYVRDRVELDLPLDEPVGSLTLEDLADEDDEAEGLSVDQELSSVRESYRALGRALANLEPYQSEERVFVIPKDYRGAWLREDGTQVVATKSGHPPEGQFLQLHHPSGGR